MVARVRMSSSSDSTVAKPRSPANALSRVDRYLLLQLTKLQLRRRVAHSQPLIPRMDLYQDDSLPSAYALFELPGISEDCIKVDVCNDALTIQGTRGPPLRSRLNETLRSRIAPDDLRGIPEFSLPDDKYRARELNHGLFRRVVQLPTGTKASDVRHKLQDGMLLVTWPNQPGLLAASAARSHSPRSPHIADARGSI
ncbi:hypothetical protein EIP91_008542 [Steccherinum ochraceum]|uniref:SHSP domain-containing protein n=1 Tax=Steccherinum ochraceum TaxID=92696 RepID=A0A4R0R5F1_9APHY|nr:hypothetical protein EIP91_008542 [Steccherinum ochraceum]